MMRDETQVFAGHYYKQNRKVKGWEGLQAKVNKVNKADKAFDMKMNAKKTETMINWRKRRS